MSQAPSHHLLDPALQPLCSAPHWYLGFSGGADSTALLLLLCDWRRANPGAPPLTALHVNHGLHPDADAWQAQCEAVCEGLGVRFQALPVQVAASGQGLEAAAREARYRAFGAALEPGAVLFLGHHQDDQVETLLLRLLRGAGVEGLSAMPARRKLAQGELCRPLLGVTRAALEAVVAASGLPVVADPANADTGLDRNFLRHEILPRMATRWPGYRASLARAAGHIELAATQLAGQYPAPETVTSACGDPGVALADLQPDDPAGAARRLRSWLRRRLLPAPDSALMAEFLRQLQAGSGQAAPLLDCGAYQLRRYLDAVYLLPPPAALPASLELLPGQRLSVPGVGEVALEPASGNGFQLPPGEGVALRFRKGGEHCRLLGRAGSAPLKKLLQEASVPPWWRGRVPLAVAGDTLLAVGLLGTCYSPSVVTQGGWRLAWQPTNPDARD